MLWLPRAFISHVALRYRRICFGSTAIRRDLCGTRSYHNRFTSFVVGFRHTLWSCPILHGVLRANPSESSVIRVPLSCQRLPASSSMACRVTRQPTCAAFSPLPPAPSHPIFTLPPVPAICVGTRHTGSVWALRSQMLLLVKSSTPPSDNAAHTARDVRRPCEVERSRTLISQPQCALTRRSVSLSFSPVVAKQRCALTTAARISELLRNPGVH